MSASTIALIILVASIVCFVTQIFPLALTAMGAALLMGIFGVIPLTTIFQGFANDVTLMVLGAMIVGEAFFETGAAQKLGDVLLRVIGYNEKRFLLVSVLISAVLSAFLSNTAVVAMMLPIVASAAARSNGAIKKKSIYMAIGFAANLGGGMTLVGSTPNVLGQGLLVDAGLEAMGFFDLLIGSIPRLILMLVFYATFGYSMQKRIFTFSESVENQTAIENAADSGTKSSSWKMWVCSLIMIAMVIGFITQIWSVGIVAMAAGLLCIFTRCISLKSLFTRMDWNTVWVMVGSLGLAAGVRESGAGELIARTILGWFGADISMFVLLVIFSLISVLLANFMSSTATIALLGPIAISMCQQLGFNPTHIIMVLIWNLNLAFLTPLGTPPITMTLQGGYRFKDYTKMGAVLTVLCMLGTVVMYPVVFAL